MEILHPVWNLKPGVGSQLSRSSRPLVGEGRNRRVIPSDHNAWMTPENLAGLVVGEGCFYAESVSDRKYRFGWRIRPAFCIELRHDDREVLEEVRAYLSCGNVYDLDFGRYRGYEARGWRRHAKYRVSNLADLQSKVVPFFRRHVLFGRKRRAFEIFAELVESMSRREHLSEDGFLKVRDLAEQLTEHNRRG